MQKNKARRLYKNYLVKNHKRILNANKIEDPSVEAAG